MVRAEDACRRERGRSPGRGGFTLIELLVVMGIMLILAGIITSTVFMFKRMMMRKGAEVDISSFTMGLAAYKRDFGAYPPTDTAGWCPGAAIDPPAPNGYWRNEMLYYYLGLKHKKGVNFYGPYVTFKTKRLRDFDGDGFLEYGDPFGGLFEYGLVLDASSGAVVRYEIVSPGYDDKLGGSWDATGVGNFVISDKHEFKDNASFGIGE
jgi:prepilin-type N-terminal cleavage/methylation domain-containing protein